MPLRDHDYARKHWSPLIKNYYAKRASPLLEQAMADAAAGRSLDATAVLKFRTELAYNFTTSNASDEYELKPSADYIAVSAEIRAKYKSAFASCDDETVRFV